MLPVNQTTITQPMIFNIIIFSYVLTPELSRDPWVLLSRADLSASGGLFSSLPTGRQARCVSPKYDEGGSQRAREQFLSASLFSSGVPEACSVSGTPASVMWNLKRILLLKRQIAHHKILKVNLIPAVPHLLHAVVRLFYLPLEPFPIPPATVLEVHHLYLYTFLVVS